MLQLLPKEVYVDIFLRLPIKNLVILACTSKTLLNFIINPDFMNAHNKKSKDNPFFLLRYFLDFRKDNPFKRGNSNLQEKETEYFCLYQDDDSFDGDLSRMSEFPIQYRCNRCFNIVGSCNGVVCLSDDLVMYSGIMYLWNPSIRKVKELPYPNVGFISHGPHDLCVGFGFDQFTNDYKVVRLVYLETIEVTPFPKPPIVEVYSLNSDSWKIIEASDPLYLIHLYTDSMTCKQPYSQGFLNGAVHWAGYKEYGWCWSIIVTFDVHQECFGEMKLPACLEGLSEWSGRLDVTTCRDMLALVQMPRPSSDYEFNLCIWVMKEYGNADSWSVLFRIDDPAKYPLPTAFYFRKNNDILILASGLKLEDNWDLGRQGYWYLEILSIVNGRNQPEELGVLEGPTPANGFYLGLYEEGLALFNEGKALPNHGVANDESHPGSVEKETDSESEN